ncbi:MAG: hypothetical protein HY778_17455 [Betaproteobacteria bacterium]|nr:hypothetical protein [Betaproteobacteria bacterium]
MHTSAIRCPLKELVKPAQVAIVVGTTLCLINGSFGSEDYTRIALNFLVPFLVSAYSRYSFRREIDRVPSRHRSGRACQDD